MSPEVITAVATAVVAVCAAIARVIVTWKTGKSADTP